MAIVKGVIQVTGGIKGVSFYTLPGSDKVIMRAKGGPSKRRMKVGDEFATVRKHQVEWAACVQFSGGIRNALGSVYKLADYNVSPVWNGLGKNLIKLDTEHAVGERNLLLSTYREALEGFNLNKNFPFNAVLRVTPQLTIDRENLKVKAFIPKLNTADDILNIQKLPYFRLKLNLGVLCDIIFTADGLFSKYEPETPLTFGDAFMVQTEWLSANDILTDTELKIEMEESYIADMTDKNTLIVSMGIEFGNVGFGGKIEAVKRAGCAKILKVI